ncbi:MAG: hypothetical protein A2X94_04980 [Bdellovibrionales bacterium GWB1_55_8]|nr:MAG: hypothetical protein A2X94_04980 [Bdellovibrionales bacterium GWB1_55_8]
MSDECPRCGTKCDYTNRADTVECPSCGLTFSPDKGDGGSTSLVRRYFRGLGGILFHPVDFFRLMPVRGGLAGPLAFALITHWLGSALSFLWSGLASGPSTALDAFFRLAPYWSEEVDHPGRGAAFDRMRDQTQEWFSGVSSVIIDPFLTLFSILLTAVFVFIGARILVPLQDGKNRPAVTYESAARIVAYGMAPAILSGLPFAGSALSAIFIAIYTILGAREVYRVGMGRAVVIALFPKLLIIGFALGTLFLIFFWLTQLIFSF